MKRPKIVRFLWPLLILWLAFGLRLYQLDFQSIWWDEGHTIFVARHPIPAIPTLPAMDVHPPAYFALLHLWLGLTGSSEFALRYLSVIFSLLTVALLWRFASVITPALLRPRILVTLLAALSPLYVAYAQEVRSYAMITCLALGSTFALWQIVWGDHPTRLSKPRRVSVNNKNLQGFRNPVGWLLIYILLTATALYTHYFIIFLLLFQSGVWVICSFMTTRNFSAVGHLLRLWAIAQLGTLLLFLPQLRLALRQVSTYTNPNLTPPSLPHFLSHTWQAYTVGLTVDPTLARWGSAAIFIILLIGCLSLVSRQRSVISRQSPSTPQSPITILLFLLTWLLLPLTAYYVVLQRQPSFEPRYMMLVTPALFLLLALGLASIPYPPPSIRSRYSGYGDLLTRRLTPYVLRFTFYVLLIILLLPLLLALHSYYTNPAYFKDDSAGVADWLAAETTPADIVYVDVPHPFHYYADQIPAPTRYLFVDIHTAAEQLNREAAGKARLYWITWRGSDTDPRGVIPFLAEKAGEPLGQRDFNGYQARWYEVTDTPFSLPAELAPVNATFGDVLRLDGLAYAETTPVEEPVWVTLHFTLLRPTDVDYKVSVRLRGEDGTLVQADRELLNDRHFRTSAWPVDDPALNQATNVYLLPPVPPGTYQLEAVLYNAAPPYPSEGVTGIATQDPVSAILGRVTVFPAL